MSFPAHLLVYVESPAWRRLLESNLEWLAKPQGAIGLVAQPIELLPRVVTTERAFAEAMLELLYLASPLPIVILSDRLLERRETGWVPTRAADVAVGACFAGGRLCHGVALTERAASVAPGHLSAVDFSRLDVPAVGEALRRATARLLLLSPSVPRPVDPADRLASGPDSVRFVVRAVESPEELARCFRLRHDIYSVLGYLGPDVQRSGLGIEADYHDGMAFHFALIESASGELAGTIRLVVPQRPVQKGNASAGQLGEVFHAQQAWFRSFASRIADGGLRRSLEDSGVACLPMLRNARPTAAWRPLLLKAASGAEMSRVITHPRYRGLGLSRLLVHRAVATAVELRRQVVFGECLPVHTEMYRGYGFREMEGREPDPRASETLFFTAQGILLDLARGKATSPGALAHWNAALFKMANPNPELAAGGGKAVEQCG